MKAGRAITVRLPPPVKEHLVSVAHEARRSLSAQALRCIEAAMEQAGSERAPEKRVRPLMGRYAGAKVPSERDFDEVRRTLWARLRPAPEHRHP